jgi:predicted phosphodiesterase
MKRISDARRSAFEIPFDDSCRFVTMSDCHRGDGDQRTDNFSKNQTIVFAALNQYYSDGYTYIELGDGDELWENKKFGDITSMYRHIYELMSKFYKVGRFHMIYGNHDLVKRKDRYVERFYSEFFPDIKVHESIVLKHNTGGNIFLVHGHQADFLNDPLWKLARFLVRYVWRSLEIIGVNDPTSAAKNYNRRIKVEKTLMKWADREHELMITGHTHRPVFPQGRESLYFNDGSCVHPHSITAIEIEGGSITLVKWIIKAGNSGYLFAGREVIAGPSKIDDYFTADIKPNVIQKSSCGD